MHNPFMVSVFYYYGDKGFKGHNDGEYTYDISTQSYKAITFLTEGKRQVRPNGGRLLVVLIKNFIYLSVCQSVITSQ